MPPPETAANDQPLIGAGPPPEIGGERGREDPRSSCGCMACGPPRKCDQHEAAASPPSRRRILTSACQTESPPHGANSRPQPARAWPRHRLLRVCGVGSAIIWGQRCGAYRQHTVRMLLLIGVHKAVPAAQFGIEKLPAVPRARQEWCDWLIQSRRLPRQTGWEHNVTGCGPLHSFLSWSLVSLATCGWLLSIRSVTQRYAHRSQTELRCPRSMARPLSFRRSSLVPR